MSKRKRGVTNTLDNYEFRNNKVKLAGPYKIRDLIILANNNIWPLILRFHLLNHLWWKWRHGQIQILTASFGFDGSLFFRKIHYNLKDDWGHLKGWYDFFTIVKQKKQEAGIKNGIYIEIKYWHHQLGRIWTRGTNDKD